jgi:head-tail adaptor
MKAGRLRSKVTFQRRATTKNAYGEPDNTWTDIAAASLFHRAIDGA